MNRRELFSSLASPFEKEEMNQESIIVRPPYYKDERDFLLLCISCEDKMCQSACEENIIIIQDDGTPKLDFTNSGCTYCNDCAKACKPNVLKKKYKQNINVTFSIDPLKCLSWNQTMCFSCKDPCLDDAIKFVGIFKPEIKTDLCTSCGFCVKVCPTNAISFIMNEDSEEKENESEKETEEET